MEKTNNEKKQEKINPKGCLVLIVMLVFVASLVVLGVVAWNTFGPKPAPKETVVNDPLDASVKQVKEYVKTIVYDPKSLKFLEWSKVSKNGSRFVVRAKFSANNSLGSTVIVNAWFTLDSGGYVLSMEEIK